ncbi:MAG: type II toxin-antitoxin system HicB family antitoxin [Chloroflexi bacterium]|nr:type II toxin-antitoxin system HicB family antitoxin [Chloroflexota bacterium]
MAKKTVTVFIIPGQESGYVAFFPFFPSCVTQGATVEETLHNAREALELALEDMNEDDLECLEFSCAPVVITGQIDVSVPGKHARASAKAS